MNKVLKRLFHAKHFYQIPDQYRNTLFVGNATLQDSVNYFIQTGHETVFSDMVNETLQENSNWQTQQAVDRTEYWINSLLPCSTVLELNYTNKRKSGYIETIRTLRAKHGLLNLNNEVGCLGSLRISPDVTADEVQANAILASYRNALYDIPLHGSAGGIPLNPNALEAEDFKSILQNYVCELSVRGEVFDIIERDYGATTEHMDWMSNISRPNIGVVSKSEVFGGFRDYSKISTDCILFYVKKILEDQQLMEGLKISPTLSGKTFILEGLGRVGSAIGLSLISKDAKCVGIKEIDCHVYDSNGIDLKIMQSYKQARGTLIGSHKNIKEATDKSILHRKADLLILAASHRTVHCYDAEKVKAKIILEVANMALTPSAYKTFTTAGKLVVPDLLIGSCQSILSYLEYLKCYQPADYKRTMEALCTQPQVDYADAINVALQTKLDVAWQHILEAKSKYQLGLNLKKVVYAAAVRKMFDNTGNRFMDDVETLEVMQ